VQSAAAVLQMAAHLMNCDAAAEDEAVLDLARMLARAGTAELDDAVKAVAAALVGSEAEK
jgi:hypothetical protein